MFGHPGSNSSTAGRLCSTQEWRILGIRAQKTRRPPESRGGGNLQLNSSWRIRWRRGSLVSSTIWIRRQIGGLIYTAAREVVNRSVLLISHRDALADCCRVDLRRSSVFAIVMHRVRFEEKPSNASGRCVRCGHFVVVHRANSPACAAAIASVVVADVGDQVLCHPVGHLDGIHDPADGLVVAAQIVDLSRQSSSTVRRTQAYRNSAASVQSK